MSITYPFGKKDFSTMPSNKNKRRQVLAAGSALKSGTTPPPTPGLQTLVLNNTNYSQTATPGTLVGTISGKTTGTKLELTGSGGKLMLNSDRSQVVVGLLGSKNETINATLTEYNDTTGETKSTNVAFTCGGLSAIDLNSASQTPALVLSVERPTGWTYASGNAFGVRDSTNTLRTLTYDATTGKLILTGFPGAGDGVTYGIATWYDQSGGAHNATTSTRPFLMFEGNYATLVNNPGITNGGTGYTVGDVLTLANGSGVVTSDGAPAQLTVSSVSSGVITGVTVSSAGKYAYAPGGTGNSAVGVTGGTGTGATFTVPLTGAGTNTYTTDQLCLEYAVLGGINLKTDAFLNIGGTRNLAVLAVISRKGYSGGVTTPQPRPGTPATSTKSVLLGYGTLASGILMTSSPSSATSANSQMDPLGAASFRDSLMGKSLCAYDQPEDFPIDETAPAVDSGYVNVWFNQRGSKIAAGGDTRRHYAERDHNIADAASQVLTIGAAGNSSAQFNGRIKELIIFNPATAMTNDEVQRLSLGQRNRFSLSQDTNYRERWAIIFTGQSNSVSHMSHTTSGDNSDPLTQSATRRIRAKIAEGLNYPAERIMFGYSARSCVGGTAMLKRGVVGVDTDRALYWWDEDSNDWGTLSNQLGAVGSSVVAGGSGYVVGDIVTVNGGTSSISTQIRVDEVTSGAVSKISVSRFGNYTVAPTGTLTTTGGTGTGFTLTLTFGGALVQYLDTLSQFKNKRIIILHAQGEEDSVANMDDTRCAAWAAQTYAFLNKIRTYCGQPDAPIIIQPLARYGGAAGSARRNRVNTMRRLQNTYLASQYNVFVAADTGVAARAAGATTDADQAQFDAHLGAMFLPNGYNASTGGAEDGYQNVGWRDSKAVLHGLKAVYGKDLVVSDVWRGPKIKSVTRNSGTEFDLEVFWPIGSGGSDLSSNSGNFSGVRAWQGATEYYPTTIIKQTIGGKLYLRCTFGSALPSNVNFAYEANYAGGEWAAPVRNHPVDNNTEIAMPLESSDVFTA